MNQKKPASTGNPQVAPILTSEMQSAIAAAEEEVKATGETFSAFADELLNGLYSIERHLAVMAHILTGWAEHHAYVIRGEVEALYKNEEKKP